MIRRYLRLLLIGGIAMATASRGQSPPVSPSVAIFETGTETRTIELMIGPTEDSVDYDVQRTYDLLSNNWDLIGTITGNGGTVTFDDSNVSDVDQAFYRIVSPAPTPTPSPTPEESPTPTPSPTPEESPTPTPTPTPALTPTPTPTPEEPTPTPTPTPEQPTPTPTPTPEEPTPTPTPTPEDPTPTPTATPTPTPGAISTLIPQSGWTLWYVDSQEMTAGVWGAATPGTNAFDGDPNTFWHTEWVNSQPGLPHEIQINLGAVYSISGFRHLPRQDGLPNGRIGQYEFYVSEDGMDWGDPVASGALADTTAQSEVLFAPKSGQYVRLRALSNYSPDGFATSIAELNVLTDKAPHGSMDSPANDVTIMLGESVNFTGSGIDADNNVPLTYLWKFGAGSGIADSTAQNPGVIQFNTPGIFTVSFTVTNSRGLADPTPPTRTVTVLAPGATLIPQAGWTLQYVDSYSLPGPQPGSWEAAGAATNAFDGDPNTSWNTQYFSDQPPPHEIQINLGATYSICGFHYLPRQGASRGRIGEYEFYVSQDGLDFGTPVATGTFINTGQEQEVLFSPRSGRYIRLRILTEVNGQAYTVIAELNVLQAGTAFNQAPTGSINSPAQDATIVAGTAIDFQCAASDSWGNFPLTYRWSFQPGSGIDDITAKDPGLVRFNQPGTFAVTLTIANSLGVTTQDTRTITVLGGSVPLPKSNWTLWFADSEEVTGANEAATNAFDGDPNTFWETAWSNGQVLPPHEIQIDLGVTHDIGGFRYLPRQDGLPNGHIGEYRFYVSTDGIYWGSPVAAGTFPDTSEEQEVLFASTRGRYIRLQVTTPANGDPTTSIAELEVLEAPSITPSVRLIQPKSNYLQASSDLYVLAEASLSSGQGVRLTIDGGLSQGGAEVDVFDGPYEATFSGINMLPHTIDAFIIDSGGTVVSGLATHDQALQVGVGDYYVAMGDSITEGVGDDIQSDDSSQDGRTTGGGYEPILADLLSAATGRPAIVYNEGIGGDTSLDGVGQTQRLLRKHPYAKRFLIMYGTNDGEPSGLGLHPGDTGYADSFKDHMQRIINDVRSAGKTAILAKVPAILPANGQRDIQIQESNLVIDELVADPANGIPFPAPDFHAYFQNHPEEYSSFLHPNGTGYQAMANLWFQTLIP